MVVKICIAIRYQDSTGFAVLIVGLLNLYRPSTGIAVVETKMTIYYRLSTAFLGVKTVLLQSFNRLCGSQDGFVKSLHAFNWPCSCQNVLAEHLQSYPPQTFTTLLVVKLCPENIYRPPTGFVVGKTGFLSNYKSSTTFAVVKIGLSNLYRPSTWFAAPKTGLWNLRRASTRHNWLAELLSVNRQWGNQN